MSSEERRADTGRLREVAETFAVLGAEVRSGTPAETLDKIARASVRHVPGARRASLTSLEHDHFRTVAATDDVARRADAIQYELGSGPCVDAIVDDTLYRPEDLTHDARWPEYGRNVSERFGIKSMLSFRLQLEVGNAIVGLNMYGDEAGAFGDESLLLGLMLATHGALAAALAASDERVAHLEKALRSNREIGVAMGVVMARYRVTRDQAFDLLRMASQNSNQKLRDLAVVVADTGELPSLDRP